MPGTVDDFMNRFAGGGTIDDNEAQQYHDRFVSTVWIVASPPERN
jgi:hypothetical protein